MSEDNSQQSLYVRRFGDLRRSDRVLVPTPKTAAEDAELYTDIDKTLTMEGCAAEAKAVGDRLTAVGAQLSAADARVASVRSELLAKIDEIPVSGGAAQVDLTVSGVQSQGLFSKLSDLFDYDAYGDDGIPGISTSYGYWTNVSDPGSYIFDFHAIEIDVPALDIPEISSVSPLSDTGTDQSGSDGSYSEIALAFAYGNIGALLKCTADANVRVFYKNPDLDYIDTGFVARLKAGRYYRLSPVMTGWGDTRFLYGCDSDGYTDNSNESSVSAMSVAGSDGSLGELGSDYGYEPVEISLVEVTEDYCTRYGAIVKHSATSTVDGDAKRRIKAYPTERLFSDPPTFRRMTSALPIDSHSRTIPQWDLKAVGGVATTRFSDYAVEDDFGYYYASIPKDTVPGPSGVIEIPCGLLPVIPDGELERIYDVYESGYVACIVNMTQYDVVITGFSESAEVSSVTINTAKACAIAVCTEDEASRLEDESGASSALQESGSDGTSGSDGSDDAGVGLVPLVWECFFLDEDLFVDLTYDHYHYSVTVDDSSSHNIVIGKVPPTSDSGVVFTFELYFRNESSGSPSVTFNNYEYASSAVTFVGDEPEFNSRSNTVIVFRSYDVGETWIASVAAEWDM